jgi:LL-diaminopimelate aminotransferase
MIRMNEHYLKLQASYLFVEIAKRVNAYLAQNPERKIIRLGIGDVTRALPAACTEAFHKAVEEMANDATFRGYGPEQGYEFLREKIAQHDFHSRGADISADEVFVSDGAKCDTGNFQELFAADTRIAVPDPVYPVYVDTNVMAGRTNAWENGRYEGLTYLESTEANEYVPALPKEKVDLIYLCFPNNPTGRMITKEQLRPWVEYAREHQALILYDAAYVEYIRDDALPQSIYEIAGAQEVAVEFRSFSKTAGFTGTRCAYTVVPRRCQVYDTQGQTYALHALWDRRQSTKFNGVSYPVQRAAEAVFSPEGKKQIRELSDYYLANAQRIRETMGKLGFKCVGGEHAPYVWIKTGMDSWAFFDHLLQQAGVVCTPGAGFGKCGEGYVRLSAFNSHENVAQALQRITDALGSR